MNETVQTILTELSHRLETLYETRLKQLVLFGSQARGDATPGSDIDVLVVLDGPVKPGAEVERCGGIIADLSLRYDTVISCQYVSTKRFFREQSPILRNIRREGITTWPAAHTKQQTLENFRAKETRADYLTEPKPDQLALLRKAADSLRAAKLLASQGFNDFAISRAYYTMFYITTALLLGEGLSFSKHSAVIAKFGQHFAKTGRVPVKFHRYLIEAQNSRHVSDYDLGPGLDHKETMTQISRAELFLELAEKLIGPIPPTD